MADRDGGGALNHTGNLKDSCHDQSRDSFFAPDPSNCFLGSRATVNFGAVGRINGSGNSFYQTFDPQESGDEYLDDYFSQPEKKKRLSVDQIQFLERSFEVENKLEPERKTQLADELGLQPRQVAVWFQNRRARWKTKQLETDYETLHASYKSLKMDYDYLLKENEKLKAEVFHLKHNGLAGGIVKFNSLICDTDELSKVMPKEAVTSMISTYEESKVSAFASRNDDQSSAKSDVTNADSPQFLGPDQLDLSHNGEDRLNEELLQGDYMSPKIEDACYYTYANSCGYGFAVEDHALSFWPY